MIAYPAIDPIAISLGPLKVHWYGLMYVVGILGAWLVARRLAPTSHPEWGPEVVEDLIFYGALGVVLGGRLGYMLFYNFPALVDDPLNLLKVWQGGMAFHGGLLGVLGALWWLGRRTGIGFFPLTDFIAPLVPIGLFAGRIGNFINGELWGKPTDVPWGMAFPEAGPLARHPSQLYEAGLEGLVLFAVLMLYARKPRPTMAVSGLFMAGYGVCRFAVEFVREPDRQLGYLAFDWLTMGQLLTLPMVAIGAALMILAQRRQPAA